MNNTLDNMLKLSKLRNLKLSWGGHGELPFSNESINFFINVISKLKVQPEIEPTGNESLLLTFDLKESDSVIIMELKVGEISFGVFEDEHSEKITINTGDSESTVSFINSKVYDEDISFNLYYDDQEFLKEHIKDLRTLQKIEKIRIYKDTKHDIFLFNNSILMNSHGNIMFKNNQSYGPGVGYSVKRMPDYNQTCPHCKEKFELEDVINDNCVQVFTKWSDDGNEQIFDYYHKHCSNAHNNEVELERFIDIVSETYPDIMYKNFHAIKNKYCPCDHCADWFVVDTPDGRFIIGWRKRVIQIIWLDDYKKFTDNFEDQNVTRNICNKERYIHAWSEEMAKSYIKRAKNSIIKEDSNV